MKKLNVPLQVDYVTSKVSEFEYPYNWKFFLILFIILAFVVLVLLSTLMKDLRTHKIFSGFALQNSLRIFEYKESRLNTFNGVKSWVMLWVICGH